MISNKTRTRRMTWALVLAAGALLFLCTVQVLAQSGAGVMDADLQVSKDVNTSWAAPGDTLTYTITIQNTGDPAGSVWLTDTLPVELTYVTDSLTATVGGFGVGNNVITWTAEMDGYTAVVTFSAEISSEITSADIVNTARVTGAGGIITDEAETLVMIPTGHLEASKSVYPDQARPGEYLTYTVRITNTGDGLVETAWMTDELPSEVSYARDLASTTGSWDVAGDVITWTGSLAPVEVVTITFVAQITSTLSENTRFTNTAVITGAGALVEAVVDATVIVAYKLYFPMISHNYPPIPDLNTIPTPADHAYTVSWQGVELPVDNYVLQQARTSDFSAVENFWTPIGISQLVQDVYCSYYYRVRADSASDWGEGPWSNVEAGVADPPDPPILDNIPAPGEDNSYTVSWSSVSVPVDRYVLQESTNANFTSVTDEWQITTLSQLVEKGSTYDTFYYRVRADDDDCWVQGAWSNVESVTTVWSYFDDFSDYQSGWQREWSKTRGALYQVKPDEHPACPDPGCEYDDGDGYVIARRSGSNPRARFGPGVAIPSGDYEIEVDTRWWDANYFATYQIFFGSDNSFADPDNLSAEYYALQVRINTTEDYCEYSVIRHDYSLLRHIDSTEYLMSWTRDENISCLERHAPDVPWNHWLIRREGTQIAIYVNDVKLGQWTDSHYGANRYFGVGATLYEGFTPSKPEFDNWSVVTLS